ncbi:unnamed protein product, partial [Prorocentrum cordatum]
MAPRRSLTGPLQPGRQSPGEEPPSFQPLVQMDPYLRLYRALLRPPGRRTPRDLREITAALAFVTDPAIYQLVEDVRERLAERVALVEAEAGTQLFDTGDRADRLFIVWSGSVQVAAPRDNSLELRARAQGSAAEAPPEARVFEKGSVFGEPGPEGEARMQGRATALEFSQLLVWRYEDYRQCLAFSHEDVMRERVAFLRAAERSLLEGVPEPDLRATAALLGEESFSGEREILRQGAEVDRVIIVKRGLCKVIRQLHPRFTDAFAAYSEVREPARSPPAGPSSAREPRARQARVPREPGARGASAAEAEGQRAGRGMEGFSEGLRRPV